MLQGNITPKDVLNGQINGLEKIRGYSAYEVACINGFEGTEAEWLATLRGDPGFTPVRGIDYWTEDDQYAVRVSVAPVIISHGPDNMCDYTASEIYDLFYQLSIGDSARQIWLYCSREDWLLPLKGFDAASNACFERTMLNEEGKPVLVSFTIDKDGWLTRTDSNLPVIDDSQVGADAWSSKNIVDKLCPSFTKSGYIVTCEPVEGYPLAVEAQPGLATEVTRCGKNLIGFADYNSEDYTEKVIIENGLITRSANVHFASTYAFPSAALLASVQNNAFPTGTYVLSLQNLTYSGISPTPKFYADIELADGTAATMKEGVATEFQQPWKITKMRTTEQCQWSAGASLSVNIQLEVGNTATAFEPYNGGTFNPGDTVPALPGINTIFADAGTVTVTGRADPNATIQHLADKVNDLSATITALTGV